MENVILIIHLIVALVLVAVVLLQRSEGGALGIGGGGGGGAGGLVTGRGAATALTKLTWGLGAAFVVTSMSLTILAVRADRDTTVIERPDFQPGEVPILTPEIGGGPAVPPAEEEATEGDAVTPPAEGDGADTTETDSSAAPAETESESSGTGSETDTGGDTETTTEESSTSQ